MSSLDTMCQGARLLGMTQKDERNLESYFRRLIKHNGSEYVISKLKVLKQHSISKLQDPDHTYSFEQGDPSISWNRRFDSPRGPLHVIYKTWTKPESRIRGIGMLINTIIEDHVTEKQLDKLLGGVNSDSRYADGKSMPIDHKTAVLFADGVEKSLSRLKIFSGLDLTASMLPFGNFQESMKDAKKGLTSPDPATRHQAIAEMTHFIDGQWIDCPPIVYDYLKQNVPAYANVKLTRPKGVIARDYEYSSKYKTYGRHIDDYSAGTVSFLQKPGGKLRVVYNTNRVINHALKPYAAGLVHAFYDQFPRNIFVERQDKGKETVQQMLKRGHTLVSADLTSATDYLNPRPFYNGLRLALAKCTDYGTIISMTSSGKSDLTHDMKEALKSGIIAEKDAKFIHAMEAIDLFERVAEMPFYSEDLDTYIGLRSGQPLGMMGSFHTLTAMNFMAGRLACESSHGRFDPEIPQFACDGDDFVGDESIMDDYSRIISSWGGKDNHEKALRSDHEAEFLSHLITRDHIVAMKPKFNLGHNSLWLNSQKSTVNRINHVYRLSEDDKQALETLASIGDPMYAQQGFPATDKRMKSEQRRIIESAMKTMSLFGLSSSDSVDISPETSALSREVTDIDRKYEGTELDRRTYSNDEHGKRTYTGISRPLRDHEDDHLSTTVDHYDHKTGERVKTVSLAKANKAIKSMAYLADELARAISGDTDAEKASHKIPYHTVSKVSNGELLLQGMNQVEQQRKDMNHDDPFPSSRSDSSEKNLIDRGRKSKSIGLDPSLLDDHKQSVPKTDDGQEPDELVSLFSGVDLDQLKERMRGSDQSL